MNKLLTNLLTKTGTKFVFASALLVAIGAVSLSGINTAHAQAPSLNLERLDDYSLRLTWANIRTDHTTFNILVDESGVIDEIAQIIHTAVRYTFFGNSDFAASRELFARVNVADRLGVAGNDGTNERVDVQWVDVPSPNLRVERLIDNSIRLTWDDIHTNVTSKPYQIFVMTGTTETFVNGALFFNVKTAVINPDHFAFNQINNADQVGIAGSRSDGSDGTEYLDLTFQPVPAHVGISSLDGDESGVSIKDAKFLYYAHALDLAPEDSPALATVLDPLTSAVESELGGLLTTAREELLVDLNGDRATNAEDAAVLYYSFALEGALGNGTDAKPGLPDIKRAILGPLARTNDMDAINAMLQRVYEHRGP